MMMPTTLEKKEEQIRLLNALLDDKDNLNKKRDHILDKLALLEDIGVEDESLYRLKIESLDMMIPYEYIKRSLLLLIEDLNTEIETISNKFLQICE